ncbi:hypothetical protein F3Y22_tig00112443pilonHSYRG00027 [Hibiscus syriacus]|uniref:Peptidase metallopeptidase domain-containing protein n=1 Tax=Hibiscus syriacus TaxID=106335 RepID=A0A6A2Y7S2_HIBSY|nr:hypothetical protein F3Y22_tig00112443pilonHSYRG00027 [Hibiscus syriacus]
MIHRYASDVHGNGFVLHRRYHDRFLQRRPWRRRTVRWGFSMILNYSRNAGSIVIFEEKITPATAATRYITSATSATVTDAATAILYYGFHLDADENWVVFDDVSRSAMPSTVDLKTVAVHEIGHLLGLGHSSVEDAIMYPMITSGTRKVEPGDDDIQGIQSLYDSNPNYNGSTTPTTTTEDRESSDGEIPYSASRWTLAGFLAIGVQILLL